MVPFGKKQLYFTDDSATNIFLYAIVGIDKAKGWVLVKESDPQVSHYYLIDQKMHSIDTLIGYPYFLNDKVICIENEQTDGSGPIEVYQILKGRFSLIAKGKLGLCAERIKSYSFFLNEKNELMSDSPVYGEDQIVDQSYWCIKIPLF